jgi:hypothetical protein
MFQTNPLLQYNLGAQSHLLLQNTFPHSKQNALFQTNTLFNSLSVLNVINFFLKL